VFFIGFLPPIIFNSGYTLRRKVFLYYFVPIVFYAVIGTFLSSLFVGLSLYALAQAHLSYSLSMAECLAFGALISATDPVSVLSVFEQLKVDPLMFYLVFGESVLNDAVALVLFNIFSKFVGTEAFTTASMGFAIVDFLIIFFGSMAVGFLFGCLSALLFKHIDLRHSIYEMGVYLLLAYIPSLFGTAMWVLREDGGNVHERKGIYMAAWRCFILRNFHVEHLRGPSRQRLSRPVPFLSSLTPFPLFFPHPSELSGIVCILFTGMFSRHYTHRNLSVKGQALAFFIFSLLAVLSETAVFLELGLSVFSGEKEYFHPLLIIWTLLLILIGRALNIYPISFLVGRQWSFNLCRCAPSRRRYVVVLLWGVLSDSLACRAFASLAKRRRYGSKTSSSTLHVIPSWLIERVVVTGTIRARHCLSHSLAFQPN
jgi:sodium/hydrogen exchanger 8